MFSLHETTRIYLCRVGFFALCAVPSLAVILWGLYVNSSAYTRSHERAIEAQLGWRAKLARASSPRPDLLLYEGLDLLDAETGQLLARFPAVEMQGLSGDVVIRVPLPTTINGQRLAEFWRVALAQLREKPLWRSVQFEAPNMTLHLAQGDQSFTDIVGHIHGEVDQRRLSLNFRRATGGDTPPEPAELNATRDYASTPPTTTVHFVTGSTTLPCEILSGVWPAVGRLGRASTIQGRAQATEQSGSWQAELSGQLKEVDLDLLVRNFPHKLSGTAQVDFDAVMIRDGRIESASGTLLAGPGTISRSLIHAAQSTLDLPASSQAMTGPDNCLAYQRLALAFTVTAEGLAIHGAMTDRPGIVLVDKTQVLLREPKTESQPVLNLVRALVPQTSVQVPATRETDELTRLLPVPVVGVPPGQEEMLPNARSLRIAPKRK
jgi:hypothetical protein